MRPPLRIIARPQYDREHIDYTAGLASAANYIRLMRFPEPGASHGAPLSCDRADGLRRHPSTHCEVWSIDAQVQQNPPRRSPARTTQKSHQIPAIPENRRHARREAARAHGLPLAHRARRTPEWRDRRRAVRAAMDFGRCNRRSSERTKVNSLVHTSSAGDGADLSCPCDENHVKIA